MTMLRRVGLWGLLGSALFLLAGCGLRGTPSATAEPATVTQLDVAETIEASGSVEADQFITLAWKTSGVVAAVNVVAGGQVKAGDVLMTLDATTAPANFITAQSDYNKARQDLDTLLHPSEATLAKARRDLLTAYTGLQQSEKTLDATLLRLRYQGDADVYTALRDAQETLADARAALPLPNAALETQSYYRALRLNLDTAARRERALDAAVAAGVKTLVEAEFGYQTAVWEFINTLEGNAVYDNLLTANTAVAVRAESLATLDAAIDRLETLTRGPAPVDLGAAQNRVQAAQATLNSLAIIAPFDGEVLALKVQAGDTVVGNQAAVVLANRQPLFVAVKVDESEVGAIQVGNPAEITLDARADLALTGKVVFVDPVGVKEQGLVKYTVRVDLDPTTEPVFLGATANVVIQTRPPQAMLAVPIDAVHSDAEGEYVNRIGANGAVERVSIVSGQLVGDLVVVVSAELRVGDKVELTASTTQNNFRSGPFGQQ